MIRTRALLTAPDEVLARLRDTGLAHVTVPTSRAAFAAATRDLLAVYTHPDAGADGVTVLRPRPDGDGVGRAGFTREALLPHTERAGAQVPPHLMLLACARSGTSGGQTALVDGADVFAHLCAYAPQAAVALSARGAAYFGGAAGHAAPVFEHTPAGRWTVRLRLDSLARFSPQAEPHRRALLEAIDTCTTSVLLEPGQGVVLDNRRWLHGRRPFSGHRVMWRVLGFAHAPLAPGFFASWALPHPPHTSVRSTPG